MEVIKRKILLETSTDRSSNDQNWGVMTASTFYINVLLTQNMDDMGLFTDMEFISSDKTSSPPQYGPLKTKLQSLGLTFPFMSAPTPVFNTINTPSNLWNVLRFPYKTVANYYNYVDAVITAFTETRIDDVRSYSASQPFRIGFAVNKQTYFNYENNTINGVDQIVTNSFPKKYVFDANDDSYIGTNQQTSGLQFTDYDEFRTVRIDGNDIDTRKTTVRYIGEGFNETNTSLSALTKEEYLFGIISPPEVQNDVFIDRGSNSVLDKHLRLSEIRNLKDLEHYGNGFYKLNKQ